MADKKLVDQLFNLGLGLTAYSEEKVSRFLKDVAARGEARQEDISRFRDDLREKGDAFRREFSRRVSREVEAALKKMRLAAAGDLEALQKQLETLADEQARLAEEIRALKERLDATDKGRA